MSKHHSVLSVETFKLLGTLFAPDVLQRLFKGALDRDYAYGVPAGMTLADEYGRAFRIAVAAWKQFLSRREKEPQKAQRKFLESLFRDALGFSLAPATDNTVPFRLAGPGTLPIFFSWFDDRFDETAPRFSGDGLSRRKRSVTQYAQEWLNERDDYLWAIVTNGRLLRLVRDSNSLTRPCWVEFDLERILSEERYADFTFLWRLCYHDRAGADGSGNDSVWEKLHALGEEEGVRVFNDLRDGVVRALQILGNGFLHDTRNAALRTAVDDGSLTDAAYFQELLRVAYRFLFLYTAEERKALLSPSPDSPADAADVYGEGYSQYRLIRRALRVSAYDRHTDLWTTVKIVFRALANGEKELALPALGGLFRSGLTPYLDEAVLDNKTLLEATAALRWTQANGAYQLIDYRNLDTEEFGSVYESLLELVPTIPRTTHTFGFVGITEEGLTSGNARKTSGSYYTPSCLVEELVKSTIDPLIKKRLAGKTSDTEREAAILSLAILDPACGSAHFLLAAARRVAETLAKIRAGEAEAVTGELYREALRDVIANCVYGVDLNPMALELAKIALWIETIVPGRPLGFLDAHFICGNSILGISRLKQLDTGIPGEAFDPVGEDDKQLAKTLKAKNAAALKDLKKNPFSTTLFVETDAALVAKRQALEALPEGTVAEVEAKRAAFAALSAETHTRRLWSAADLYTAAFLLPKSDPSLDYPDTAQLRALRENAALGQPTDETLARCTKVCSDAKALHWPLVFPRIFDRGGFDVVLANPPWDRIKIQAKEFFATRYPDISEAKNASQRNKLIAELAAGGLAERQLLADFNAAVAMSERTSAFVHAEDGHYPLTGVGDVNLYALFAELILQILSPDGRAGFVCPTGICTDNSTKEYFNKLVSDHRLESLYDFENRQKLFPSVDSRYKFALLTIGKCDNPDFAFFLLHPKALSDARRHFSLTAEEFDLINPNTHTAPVCRSGYDAELLKKIYRKTGVLVKDGDGQHAEVNPWGVSYQRLFDMSNDSRLFAEAPGADLYPLYEAKMMHIFDHRWATFTAIGGEPSDCTAEQKSDPTFEPRPQYWVSKRATHIRLADIPTALFKAAKKGKLEELRVAFANWVVTTFPGAAVTHADIVRQLCGDAFYDTLPKDWLAKKFVADVHKTLTAEELESIGDGGEAFFDALFECRSPKWLIGWRKIARAADSRTHVSGIVPITAAGDSLQFCCARVPPKLEACLLAEGSSLVLDFVARNKIGGSNFNFFAKSQLPALAPSAYTEVDIAYIVPRVLELTYTSHALKPWAEALGYAGEPYAFDERRRALLKAELDAYYAKLYGLTEEEFRYILDPTDVKGTDFPSESFRTLRDDELKTYGEYLTRRLALDAWRRLQEEPQVLSYVRKEKFEDRDFYLRTLVGQLLAQSSTHEMPVTELFEAFSALRDPHQLMTELNKMPVETKRWFEQYQDAIRADERLEQILDEMFDDGAIAISRDGIVSVRDDAILSDAAELPDVALDARLALAFARLTRSVEKARKIAAVLDISFMTRIREAYYARAA